MDVLLELLPLVHLKVMSFPFDLITTRVWEVLICLLHLDFPLLPLPLYIVHLLSCVLLDEVLLHHVLHVHLLLSVVPKLLLHEPREVLLLSYLDLSIECVQTALILYLLHVQVKHILVTHLETTHEHTLAKFIDEVRSMNQGEPGFGGRTWGSMQGVVTFVTDAGELMLAFLRVRVREVVVHVT